MQLFNAENSAHDLTVMGLMLDSLPCSSPLPLNKIKEVEKSLSLFYPISWREIARLCLLRKIQLRYGKEIAGCSSLQELIENLEKSVLSSPSFPKEYFPLIKKLANFGRGVDFEKKAETGINLFLSLSVKGLDMLSWDVLEIGAFNENISLIPTKPQLELVLKAIRGFSPNKKEWKILDVNCGYGVLGSYLFTSKKTNESMAIYGLNEEEKNLILNQLEALAEGRNPKNYFLGDFLAKSSNYAPYDVVITNLSWGIKTSKSKSFENFLKKSPYSKELKLTQTVDWACATKMIDLLSKEGIGIWFTNSQSLTSTHNKQIVDRIMKENLIAGIVRLPQGCLSSNNTSPVMVIFKKGRSHDEKMIQVDARQFVQKGRKQLILPTDSIIQMVLGKKRCCLTQSVDPLTMLAYEKKKDTVFLKDVALDIFRGTDALTDSFITSHHSESKDSYLVLRLNEMRAGLTNFYDGPRILLTDEEKADLGKFSLKKGDILIKSRGGVNTSFPFSKELGKLPVCLVYEGEPQKVLATASIMVVRPDPTKLDSLFLKFYLQSRIGMEELNLLASGKNSFLLTKATLGNLKLPLPKLEDQKKLGQDCQQYSVAIFQAYKEFQDKLEEFMSYLYKRFKKGE